MKLILWLRSMIFNVVFFVATFLLLTAGCLAFLFPPPALLYVVRQWAMLIIKLLRIIVGLRYTVEGMEHVTFPCIIASKHQSTWDTLIFHVLFDNPAYVLKKELNRLTFGAMIRRLKLIVVDRDAGHRAMIRLLSESKKALEDNRPIIIFPEGTRTNPGEKVPYYKGIGALYKQLKVPVIPLALNSGLFWGRRSFWKYPGVITLRFLPPIAPGLQVDVFMDTLTNTLEEASEALLKGLPEICFVPPLTERPPPSAQE